jgi:16S rRNA (adenine1518-N6/adenine1519-N6)-dimethyltransferase
MRGFAPKRQFSQNFLTDVGIARNIVGQLVAQEGDHVLEVGPGKGALTKLLLETPVTLVHAVDLDPRAPEFLGLQSWSATKRFVCSVQDALHVHVGGLFPGTARMHRKIIGNIPYAITSELLFWAFSQHRDASRVVFMMQREVAKRCVAHPGTKDYGILSVATWLHSEAKIAFHVQPGSFFPRPEVTSSVIAFSLRETLPLELEAAPFMEFVRAAFSQRRKVLSNALASWGARYGKNMRVTFGVVDLTRTRAEELAPESLAVLYLDILKS